MIAFDLKERERKIYIRSGVSSSFTHDDHVESA